MPKNRILAFGVTALMVAMLGVLLYQAFDSHDTQPFPVDPEIPLFMLGSLLVLCIGNVALSVGLLSVCLSLTELLPLGRFCMLQRTMARQRAFEVERLLFSPPLRVISLRV